MLLSIFNVSLREDWSAWYALRPLRLVLEDLTLLSKWVTGLNLFLAFILFMGSALAIDFFIFFIFTMGTALSIITFFSTA